jgi:hypothetical protein
MPDVASTGAATLSVNGQTAKPLKKQAGAANLVSNDLLASPAPYLLTYDGVNWDMQSQTGNASGGGGSGAWPSPLPYYVGRAGGGPAESVIGNTNWVPGTVYCYDTNDPYILTPTAIAGFAGSFGSATTIAIAVFDSSGTRLLSTNLARAAGGPDWAKWPVSGTTLNAGYHSWCTAFQATAGVGTLYIPTWSTNFVTNSLDISAGIAGAPMTLYTCNTGTTGNGSTFAIPQFGNCPLPGGHGVRTHADAGNIGIPNLIVY